MTKDDIMIRKGIIHILEGELGNPVYSEQLLELTPDINDFFREHIYKLLASDDLKKCYFSEEEPSMVYEIVKEFSEDKLVEDSKKITQQLYQIMNANISIPSADFAVVTFQLHSKQFLALLKMNYKQSFLHMTSTQSVGNVNQIIKYQSTLPTSATKLSEAVIIDLSDASVQIVEKKYEVNGQKVNYLSELFLHCKASMSSKTKLAIVTKAVDQLHDKYYENEPIKKMEAKRIIQEEMANNEGTLRVEKVAQNLFGDQPDLKEEFEAKMEKYHMEKAEVTPQAQTTTRKFEKQYLKTDTGIEINIPMDQYQDVEQVEFITNPDGTISVLIKNINRIMTK